VANIPTESLQDWLDALDLGQYSALFAEHGIDARALRLLSEDDLKELGLPIGHRRKLLDALDASRASLPTSPSPERRQVTVLFCDMVGSTELAGRLDPEDLREALRAYLDFCAQEVERHGGTVARYMGDGLIAYFGYPRAFEDAAERAVRAGCTLTAGVVALHPRPDVALQVRVGIATGVAVLGDMLGDGAAREEAVIGPTPFLAARLQTVAPPGGVAIAEATRRLLGRRFLLEDIGVHELKGIGAPTRVWRVIGERVVATRFDSSPGADRPLLAIGRAGERAILRQSWEAAVAGRGRAALIIGAPGIGKSHLVMTLCDDIRQEPHTLIQLQCSALHASTPLHPVISWLSFVCGLTAGQDAEEHLARVRAAAAAYDAEPALFARLLSVTVQAAEDARLSAAAMKQHTFAALREWLARLARAKPVVLVVEDLHWTDPTTMELVESWLDQISGQRVLLLITQRPEHSSDWSKHGDVVTIHLSGLAPPDVAQVVQALTDEDLPEHVVRQIVDRADGVPLFAEELTRTALEWRNARHGNDAAARRTFKVPETLQDSLLARLDRLGRGREVTQVAAAIGREFRADLLCRVTGMPKEAIWNAISEASVAGLVQPVGTPTEGSYAFRHVLVQEAAYATLLHSRRRDIHARIGRALEDGFPEIAETQPELVAHHYTEAMLLADAIAWWSRGAERSQRQSANFEAVQQFQRALELLARQEASAERDSAEIRLRSALAGPLMVARGPGSVEREENLAALSRLHQRRSDTRRMFPDLYAQSVTIFGRGEMLRSMATITEYLRLAVPIGDPVVLAVGHMHLGYTQLHLGRIRAAVDNLDRALMLCKADDPEQFIADFPLDVACFATSCRALGLQQLGQADAAVALAALAVDRAFRSGHVRTLLMVLFLAGMERMIASDADGAAAFAGRLDHVAARTEGAYWRTHADLIAGWAIARGGRPEEGLARMRSGAVERDRMQGRAWLPQYLAREAECLAAEGREQEALLRLDEAETIIKATEQRISEPEVYRQRARIMLARGDPRSDVEAILRRALLIAREREQGLWAAQVEADLQAAGFAAAPQSA